MTKQLVENLVKARDALKEQAGEAMKELVHNKDLPIDERWSNFLILANADLLPSETYGDGFVEELNENYTPYDNFYIERYQTVYYSDMWDRVGHLIATNKVTQANADAWREKVMEEGAGTFKYDW